MSSGAAAGESSRIARAERKQYGPATVPYQGLTAVRQCENSDVSLSGSVAVTVSLVPAAIFARSLVNVTVPLPFVVTVLVDRNVLPSPHPDGSQPPLK